MNWIFSKGAQKRLENVTGAGCIMLSGEKGLGKALAAKEIAARLIGIHVDRLPSSMDFLYIFPSEGAIKAEDIHILKEFAMYAPSSSAPCKVCIIDDADCMTKTAGNALLKTLEEHSDTNLFLLVAHDSLLPTISSRSAEIAFHPLSDKEMEAIYPEADSVLLGLASGHPGRYEDFLKDSAYSSDVRQILSHLEKIRDKRDFFEILNLIREKDKGSFFEKYDAVKVSAFLSMLSDVFLSVLMREDCVISTENIRRLYTDDELQANCLSIRDSIRRMKKKGQFSKNDFFALVSLLVSPIRT